MEPTAAKPGPDRVSSALPGIARFGVMANSLGERIPRSNLSVDIDEFDVSPPTREFGRPGDTTSRRSGLGYESENGSDVTPYSPKYTRQDSTLYPSVP